VLIGAFDVALSFHQILFLALSGVVGLSFGDAFLFKSMEEIGARLSMLVMSSVPIFSAIVSFLMLGEGMRLWEITGMALTVAGICIVVLDQREGKQNRHQVSIRGVFHGILGASGQAVALILAKEAFNSGPVNGFVATMFRILASLVVLLPYAAMTKRLTAPVRSFRNDRRALVLMLCGSFVGPYLGITFSLIAISNTNVGIASTIMSTVPIIMLPMVHFSRRERLTWKAYAGAFLAVGGTAVLFLL
jgi:drug/metabolite transporter (DMT)-like permease